MHQDEGFALFLVFMAGDMVSENHSRLRERLTLAGDTRDLLAARDSLKQLLGIQLLDPRND